MRETVSAIKETITEMIGDIEGKEISEARDSRTRTVVPYSATEFYDKFKIEGERLGLRLQPTPYGARFLVNSYVDEGLTRGHVGASSSESDGGDDEDPHDELLEEEIREMAADIEKQEADLKILTDVETAILATHNP